MQITDPPVVAAAAIVAVALGAFFTEVGVLGVSLKGEVAKAQEAAESSKVAAESAQEAAKHAQGAERSATRAEQLAAKLNQPQPEPPIGSNDILTPLGALAAEYNNLRKLPKGSERTGLMTDVVARMITMGRSVELGEAEIAPLLSAVDGGTRLAAYALLYARPMPDFTQRLTQAAIEETPRVQGDPRFGQYWALRALRRQVAMDPHSLDLNSRRRLQELQKRVGPNTDRGYELREILRLAAHK